MHIGLAFCVENINYAIFLKESQTLLLDRLGSVSYPFPYVESELFKEDKIPLLTNLITSKILSGQTEIQNISISIESNLAALKRIALPDNFTPHEDQEHIAWDLSHSLSEPVERYMYYKTDNCFKRDNQNDYLTIAIQKKVVNFFQALCNQLGLNLVDISINQLVAEIALRHLLHDEVDGLIVLFKIGLSRLETTYLWNGNFYMSNYERVFEDSQSATYKDNLVNKIKTKVKQIENLFEQYTQNKVEVNRIFLYGDNIEDNFIQSLQKNLSVIALRLNPLQNIDKTDRMQNTLPSIEGATRFVESIGVILDQ
jgi:Tfp pilus assembly PilM family ATPase